ncbi:MAG TPA: VOC family protein [Nevskiaceae bacterium]|nr:VOC family protein [Nevskiaceae bacterium]
MSSRITPFLWFDGKAEEAAKLYCSIFPNSKITQVVRSTVDTPGTPRGGVLTVGFTLNGLEYTAMNGGPMVSFNESVSFVVHCKTQEEIDHYWDRLTADGGAPVACGWLKDKYGLRWQITPDLLLELIASKDSARAQRAMQAMMKMVKIDLKTLENA